MIVEFMLYTSPSEDEKVLKDTLDILGVNLASGFLGVLPVLVDESDALLYLGGRRFHFHDDVIKWKHFPRFWPFVRGIHRAPVNSPHKGQ